MAGLANGVYLAGAAPARVRFERAMRDPARAQHERLTRILLDNAGTTFGRTYGFADIRSIRDFQQRVPLLGYDDYEQHMHAIARGARGVLTSEPVRALTPSGGSTAATKQIPWTASLKREFSAATMPWVFDLMAHRPRLRTGRSYWAISPPAPTTRDADVVVSAAPDDSDYFPAFAAALLDRILGVPRAVAAITDLAACRYLTLRALIAIPDLAFISVWNPSFLTLLADALDENFDTLIDDLRSGEISVQVPAEQKAALQRALPADADAAHALRLAFGRTPPDDLGQLWPNLDLISCWTDGHAARALEAMKRRFPHVAIQGKGLLATEGVVSFPLIGQPAPVCAVASHFLEFLPEDSNGLTCLAHELDAGERYEVVLTTGGGLYRYRLRDIVECRGHVGRTPLLHFVGRADGASDIAGEKLSPALVERVIANAMCEEGLSSGFAMLAPTWGSPPRYRLYVDLPSDADAQRLAARVETSLTESHHYALCRGLGQLESVEGCATARGAQRYERARMRRGQRAGTIKPAVLERDFGWEEAFR